MVFGISEAAERLTQAGFWQNVAICLRKTDNILLCKSAVFEAQRTGLNWGRRGIRDLIFFIILMSLKKVPSEVKYNNDVERSAKTLPGHGACMVKVYLKLSQHLKTNKCFWN